MVSSGHFWVQPAACGDEMVEIPQLRVLNPRHSRQNVRELTRTRHFKTEPVHFGSANGLITRIPSAPTAPGGQK